MLVVCHSGNLRRARLVLSWVTVSSGSIPGVGHLSRYVTSHPGQLSLAISLCVSEMSTGQREVKAGMTRVWQVKLYDPILLLHMGDSERFGDNDLMYKVLYQLSCLLFITFTNIHYVSGH